MEVSPGWKESVSLRKGSSTKIGSHCTVKHVDSKFTERGVMGQELSKESYAVVTPQRLCAKRLRLSSLISHREPGKDLKQQNARIIFALRKMTWTGCE